MKSEQLTLDLWAAPPADEPRVHDPRCWLDPRHHAKTPCSWPALTPAQHQRGHVRLPYDTQGRWKTGDLAPAWVCCLCGGVSAGEYSHRINHGCCRPGIHGMCQIVRPSNHLNPHWIPPGAAS